MGAGPDTVIVNMVYRDPPTPVMAAARARGLRAVDGWEVLLLEVQEQFHLLTGRSMPGGLARVLLSGGEPAAPSCPT